MEQGFSLKDVLGRAAADATGVQKLTMQSFNLTSDACLPVPTPTNDEFLTPIYVLIGLSLFTCAIEAYTSRLRARICNFFYPDRARERAEFLNKSLKAGRLARRNELRKFILPYKYIYIYIHILL